MLIIKPGGRKFGEVIDFSTKEPVYYTSRTKKNKVQKYVCPTCGRLGRLMRDDTLLVHKLEVSNPPNLFDACDVKDTSILTKA